MKCSGKIVTSPARRGSPELALGEELDAPNGAVIVELHGFDRRTLRAVALAAPAAGTRVVLQYERQIGDERLRLIHRISGRCVSCTSTSHPRASARMHSSCRDTECAAPQRI